MHHEIVGRGAAEGNAVADRGSGIERLGRAVDVDSGLIGVRLGACRQLNSDEEAAVRH